MEYTLVLELDIPFFFFFLNISPLFTDFENVPLIFCLLSEMNAPIAPTV